MSTPRFDPTVEVDPLPQFYAPELEVGRDGRCNKCGGLVRREPSRLVCGWGCARQVEFRATRTERELQQKIDAQMGCMSRRLARLENSRRTLTPG